ncbi:hypothetical protein ACHWQZ_G016773 [Mnemiopsis leidyi]
MTASTMLILTEFEIIQLSEQRNKVQMPFIQFNELIKRVCRMEDRHNLKRHRCLIELFIKYREKGMTVDLYDTMLMWNREMHEESQDLLKGHTYLNKDIMSFQMSYTYRNYLLPVLQEANDAAVRNGRSFATHSLILAAIISITSLVIFRLTIPDDMNLPMPNFYETSLSRRRSYIFILLRDYFHGHGDLELPSLAIQSRKEHAL